MMSKLKTDPGCVAKILKDIGPEGVTRILDQFAREAAAEAEKKAAAAKAAEEASDTNNHAKER
jgi:hypothetical protein